MSEHLSSKEQVYETALRHMASECPWHEWASKARIALAAGADIAAHEPATVRRKFDDLPKGTRFRYIGFSDVYVKLDGHDYGLVARWEGPNADAITQQVFSFADTAREARTKEVELVESAAPPPKTVCEWSEIEEGRESDRAYRTKTGQRAGEVDQRAMSHGYCAPARSVLRGHRRGSWENDDA